MPLKGKLKLRDYEKIFCANTKGSENIFKMRGINLKNGCLVIVRPDQHIASILPTNAFEEISRFFNKFMTKR